MNITTELESEYKINNELRNQNEINIPINVTNLNENSIQIKLESTKNSPPVQWYPQPTKQSKEKVSIFFSISLA